MQKVRVVYLIYPHSTNGQDTTQIHLSQAHARWMSSAIAETGSAFVGAVVY